MDLCTFKMMLASLLLVLLAKGAFSQRRQASCEQSSCYPATGDLLIGRAEQLDSSSTCGLNWPSRFCIVSHLEDRLGNQCFRCDARHNRTSHRISNIVSSYRRDWKSSWWQAENGKEKVFIQLDLEAEFHFTHLVMRFKTFRPSAMFVERSHDFGKTWHVYRYFAYDCAESFPGIPTGPIRNINEVICESRYSDVSPSTEGEVVFRVLPPYIDIKDPYAQEVQDLLKMTNLRVNFTKLHTLGDDLLDSRDDVKEKYYYSMYDMVVRGSCSCYGHASRCIPLSSHRYDPNVIMVHGRCECTHNTKGLNCEMCEDFYNDLPWRPAQGRVTNACERCNCNNHASRCHFDPAVYELTGRVSGGVCDDCQHNTMGRNCEECLPFFFRDPRIQDPAQPDLCKPCNCDPAGSEHGGECEGRTDVTHDLVAGRCICKKLVEGERCDICTNGYWNMREDNPEGCESCACSTLGTINNYGCDKNSGECRCKRYVTGRDCNQCFPEYFGLNEERDGCKQCDCDVGGALDNNCDQLTGQCNCRPHIGGRRCDRPDTDYFVPGLDYLRYEAELASWTGNAIPVERDIRPGQDITWTHTGFMKVSEGDTLEFVIDNVPYSMEYDIIIRYEPQMPERWDDVRVTVTRPGPVDQRGSCANSIPQDDHKATTLPPGQTGLAGPEFGGSGDGETEAKFDQEDLIFDGVADQPTQNNHYTYLDDEGNYVQAWHLSDIFEWTGQRYYVVRPSSCLEQGVRYRLKLDFSRYRHNRPTPEATALIDSIVLVPSTESIPIFIGSAIAQRRREEYERFRCPEAQYSAARPELSEMCTKHVFSISSYMYGRAFDCDCDPTGSTSTSCNGIGGQCLCKPNIIGRRCDQCIPGTFGFSPFGCQLCNCNDIGSRHNYCNEQTGQCVCRNPNSFFGRQCDECARGYWNFPACDPCACNGRADECDNLTGACLTCRDWTGGHNCDQCASGYYGDPRYDSNIGCRACMCPGGAESGYQHANTCELDQRSNDIVCHCGPGFAGNSCNRCAENYYGNPLIPGGKCEQCVCSGNIDYDVPNSCDAQTGECLKCIFNTEGFNCERCRDGFYGDALEHNCKPCVCFALGWDRGGGNCNRENGQCPCLPNVVGHTCDRCAPNHWKIASGQGCEGCDCDPDGSESPQCNEYTGQCRCKPGRGGRDCNQCQDLFWGDPFVQCKPCQCHEQGSATLQCDRHSGNCECMEGVTGAQCDRCARGTTGALPYCIPCGECFDNWDHIINELKLETDSLIKEGSEIKVGGPPGAFDKEFKYMEDKLEEVKRMLSGTNVTGADIDAIKNKLTQIRTNLTDSSDKITDLNTDVTETNGRVQESLDKIEAIKRRIEQLKKTAQELRNNATYIRDLDVSGAYNSTKEALRRSDAAQDLVTMARTTVSESVRVRQSTENILVQRQDHFDQQYKNNEDALSELGLKVDDIDGKIVDLNEMVCDGRGDPCDAICGGAGCGTCGGGASCGDGAVGHADAALNYSRRSENKLRELRIKSDKLLLDLDDAESLTNMAKGDAQMAHDSALRAKNISENTRTDLETMLQRIRDFLGEGRARPSEVRLVAERVLNMSIPLTPAEITDLSVQIKEVIKGLSDVDSIINATRDDLAKAKDLEQTANTAQSDADGVLSIAEKIRELLRQAAESQSMAEDSINHANQNITAAEEDITMVESETSAANDLATATLTEVTALQEGLSVVKTKYIENRDNIDKAKEEVNVAEGLAATAEKDADDLDTKYAEVSLQLEQKFNETRTAKERADRLRDRAAKLYQENYQKLERLRELGTDFDKSEVALRSITGDVARLSSQMATLVISIKDASNYHRGCEN